MPMLNAIDRVSLAVHNIEVGREAYRLLLGRDPSETGVDKVLGVAFCRFRLLSSSIELLSPLEGHEGRSSLFQRATKQLENHGEGIMAITFACQQLNEFNAQLSEQAVPFEELSAADYLGTARMIQLSQEHCLGLGLYVVETEDRLKLPFAQSLDRNTPEAVIDDIDHIVLNTCNSDVLKTCFSDQLGLSLRLDQSREEWGVRQLFYRVGSNILEVMEFLSAEQKAKTDYFWGIALAVPRLDACLERLQDNNIVVSKARKGRKKHTRVATLKSHDCGAATLLISQERG